MLRQSLLFATNYQSLNTSNLCIYMSKNRKKTFFVTKRKCVVLLHVIKYTIFFVTITKWKQLIVIHDLNSLSSRRLKSKYNPFHVYLWYTYIMAWKIIYNPILVTVVFQLPSFVIDQNLQSFIWFSWFLSNIFCSKIYNPLFDQSNEFIHVFVFYYLSLLFYHLR